MTMFLAPYTAIADIDGSPLDAGFIYFGEYEKDPELFPIEVFWDADFTVPAAQPIRTRNGYPVRNGSPTKVYLKTAQHSIVIKNRNSAFILVDFNNKGWDASFVVDGGENQHQINNTTVRVAVSVSDMLDINNPKNGQTVFAKGLQGGTFIYDSNKSSINDGVVTFNGWVRQIDGFITPFMAGAGLDGSDSSAALQIAFNYSQDNNVKLTGLGKTFHCNDVIFDSNLQFYDAYLVCNKFDTDMISVIKTRDTIDPENTTKDFYFYNIHIDGKRALHTNIVGTLGEDGGRHGFRIRNIIENGVWEKCSANYCAVDGFEFFVSGYDSTRNDLIRNCKLIDCEAQWNGRHGGSSDAENGLQIIRGKYQNNGKHITEGQPYSSGLSARLLYGAGTALYGNGWDFENYSAETQIKNVTLDNVDMRFNAKESVNFYRVHDPEVGINNNITILGGYYDSGLTDGGAIRFTTFNNESPVDRTLFDGVVIDGVDLGGQNLGLIHTNAKVSNLRNYRKVEVAGYSKVQFDADYTKEVYDAIAVVDVLSNAASVSKFGKPNSQTELNININGAPNSESSIKVMVADSHRGGFKFKLSDDGGVNTYFMNRASAILAVDDTGSIYAQVDNTSSIGNAVNRFKDIYSASGVITTSDARLKDNAKTLTSKERLVARELRGLIKTYRFKGGTRTHTGVLAQEVVAVFEAHGLSAFDYGLLCFDEWDAQDAVIDSEGNTTVAAIPASNRYAIRYDELIMFILAAI